MKASWHFYTRYCSGCIKFEDGREVFLQGEDAAELDNQLEECETEEQIQLILDGYEHIAERPQDV